MHKFCQKNCDENVMRLMLIYIYIYIYIYGFITNTFNTDQPEGNLIVLIHRQPKSNEDIFTIFSLSTYGVDCSSVVGRW